MVKQQNQLFPELDKARYGENRKYKNLFLPNILKKEAIDYRLHGEAQDQAFEIITRWAELELKGKLSKKKETTLEGEFINEIFGKALGYTLFSEDKEDWNINPKYSVNGGIADAAIGLFSIKRENSTYAIIELKGPNTNLDKDRFNGRTPIQQCWDYLNALPECPWGIVSNYVSFRLYHRDQTPKTYQHFVLQDLVDEAKFREFYYIFEKEGLLPVTIGQRPRAIRLLEKSGDRQDEIGDELYKSYDNNRIDLIHHLTLDPFKKPLDSAIRIAQKLLDRIIFIAFCEDRGLLPEKSLRKAHDQIPPFSLVTNPRWQNFLALFSSIDKGNQQHGISPFNGGLFRKDDEVDNLELDDQWTNFFEQVGRYDFRHEINVDVLGHIFEKSIKDLERIKVHGIFDQFISDKDKPKMSKSAARKRQGIYYTPPDFTNFITHNTINKVLQERIKHLENRFKISEEESFDSKPNKKLAEFWESAFDILKQIKIIDPACGSGAFLISAYDLLEEKYLEIIDQLCYHTDSDSKILLDQIPDNILNNNLYGVDLSQEAVEITQLALWIRSAQTGKTLADLSKNIIIGNSLISDKNIHPYALDWQKIFPDIFKRENNGFDCVIGNPPWERMKLQEREFFNAASPEIATAVNASQRKRLITKLKNNNPILHDRYNKAKEEAESALNYIRQSNQYPLTAKGDINTYALFAELAYNIIAKNGRVGLLVPSGIATDHTTKSFFENLTESKSLVGFYDFENKAPVFPDVHRSFKFSILLFGGKDINNEEIDFVFFAHKINDLKKKSLHITLSTKDIELINPNTKTCPIFRSQRDAEITKAIYRRVPILIDKNRKDGGNPWGIKFSRMFDQTNDASKFITAEELKNKKYARVGPNWIKGKKTFIPLYEAKMIQMYDHRAANIDMKSENWVRQGQTTPSNLVQHQNPEYFIEPRWWVDQSNVTPLMKEPIEKCFISFKDVTSPTNQRTMIASFIPFSGVTNTAPIIITDKDNDVRYDCCLLSNLNSISLDYIARQKVGGVHLNFFIIEQLPIFGPEFYNVKCPWDSKQTLKKWISERVIKLTCTSNDMIPLAKEADFKPEVYKWKSEERLELIAQLDAAYFYLYEINRDDVEYILSTFSGTKKEETGLFDISNVEDRILKFYDKLHDQINKLK